MMKHTMQKILGLTLILVATGVSAAEHEIKMLNSGKDGAIMVFEPGYLKVESGDTVKFVSTDAGHNSVSFFTPEGGTTWKGELSKEVTVTLDKEGIYLYKCEPHTVMAMVGVIQVGEAKNKEAAADAAKEITTQFTINKERLKAYLAEVGKDKATEEKPSSDSSKQATEAPDSDKKPEEASDKKADETK